MTCGDPRVPLLIQLLVYGLTNGAVVALNAAGFTLAYAASRQLNLAHGNVFALTSVAVASLAGSLGITAATPGIVRVLALVPLALGGAAVGAALNAGVERLAFRPFRDRGDTLGSLVATVGLSYLLLQAAVWWYLISNTPRPYHQGVAAPLLSLPDLVPSVDLGWSGVALTLKDVAVLVLAAGVAGVGGLWISRGRGGRLLRAVAQDPELAALCGADPRRTQTLAFAVAGALAGLGALMFAVYYGSAAAQQGLRTGLTAMTAALVGGAGNPRGALIGGLLIGVLSSYSDFFLDSRWTPVLILGLLIALLTCRPSGLLGSPLAAAVNDAPAPAPPSLAVRAPGRSPWILGGLIALGLVYPGIDGFAGWSRLPGAAAALLLVTLAVGLSLVVARAGLLDLGYAAFFAIGSYTAALLTAPDTRLGQLAPDALRQPWAALPLAGVVAAGFGVLFGLPSVRTRGEYLAIVTLAFGEIVPSVIWHLPEWTGGSRGISVIPAIALGPLGASPLTSYYLAWLLAVGGCAVAWRLGGGRIGRAWAAVRDDEVAAAASGLDGVRLKLIAFGVGAAYAGVAGSLYAGLVGHVEPEQFSLTLSLMVLAAVVIGGRWGVPGAVVGGLVVALYDRVLVDALNALAQGGAALIGAAGADAFALRLHNFAVFGLALYLATLPRRGG